MKRYIAVILLSLLSQTSLALASPKVVRIDVDGAISPSSASYIARGLSFAEKEKAAALLITLNTPGGLLNSTREIVGKMLEAKVPVIVYVYPGGARAGSAGVFITLAANVAVMAPGTNIGAAHPVGMGGESDSSVMFDKVTNDAAAFIRTIAHKRNRNPEWAENTVRNSISSTETEALDSNAIDLICPNINSLLVKVNGRDIETSGGIKRLELTNAEIIHLEPSWREDLLGIISDPNIAYILLMIGIYGLMFELYSPGAIFPGVIGVMSLILGAYSMQMLPVNYAGLGLILLAIALFIIEIKVTSYGMLTIGGVISLFLGSVMLIEDAPGENIGISIGLIITVVIVSALFFSFVITLGVKAQFRKKTGGKDAMIGMAGYVMAGAAPGKTGQVKVMGEIWKAVCENEIKAGDYVEIEDVDGFTLKIRKK